MRVSLVAASIALTAGCGRTPPPACPTPVAADADADADVDDAAAAEPDEPGDETAGAMSPDGLYACSRPRGDLVLTLRAGFTAKDLVIAYLGVTCSNVLLPVELADRSRKAGFEGRLKAAEIEPRFRALFEELGLALVRERGMAIVVDQSWLARRPGLVLLQRADPSALLLSSSPSIPPPLDTAPPPATFDGIMRIDDTHVVITRQAAIEAIAANARPPRIVASQKNGQPNGVKLYAIRPASTYAAIGFANGDTVHSLNGVAITSPADITLDKLFVPSRVELAITRRGQPLTLSIEVRD